MNLPTSRGTVVMSGLKWSDELKLPALNWKRDSVWSQWEDGRCGCNTPEAA